MKCVRCELEALDGHLTCGLVECDESGARAEADALWRLSRVTPLDYADLMDSHFGKRTP